MRGVRGVGWAPTTSTPLGVSSKLRPPSPFSAEGRAPVGHVPWRLSGKTQRLPREPSQQGLWGPHSEAREGWCGAWACSREGAGCSSPLAACHLCSWVSSQPPSSNHGDMRT